MALTYYLGLASTFHERKSEPMSKRDKLWVMSTNENGSRYRMVMDGKWVFSWLKSHISKKLISRDLWYIERKAELGPENAVIRWVSIFWTWHLCLWCHWHAKLSFWLTEKTLRFLCTIWWSRWAVILGRHPSKSSCKRDHLTSPIWRDQELVHGESVVCPYFLQRKDEIETWLRVI